MPTEDARVRQPPIQSVGQGWAQRDPDAVTPNQIHGEPLSDATTHAHGVEGVSRRRGADVRDLRGRRDGGRQRVFQDRLGLDGAVETARIEVRRDRRADQAKRRNDCGHQEVSKKAAESDPVVIAEYRFHSFADVPTRCPAGRNQGMDAE